MKYVTRIILTLVAVALSYLLIALFLGLFESKNEESSHTHVISRVIDGDTVETADGETVRLAGIDTPERGECGYKEAKSELERLVLDQPVTLIPAGDDDRDKYDRLIRYVEFDKAKVDGVVFTDDAGFILIEKGLAKARYDSRDGYGEHQREDIYVFTDAAVPDKC